ncbi:hypothetical protein [Candidatus Protochlamydia phocaeensis]|uniref:hypothetical protein n=1 Tax=Candidatus Protochlamydia phocaeensis TaxID=1414722 RepID=UPI00083969E2|nr:hypothetical protein [Candidatus Protochlamydia phocaeensis]
MQAPTLLGQTRAILMQTGAAFQSAWGKAKHAKQVSKDWIVAKFAEIGNYWNTVLWPNYFKDFYENNIQPITKGDLIVGGTCTGVALAITFLTPAIFGLATFALSGIAGFTIILGTCAFLRHQVRSRHNEMAWDHVDQIRRAVNRTTKPSHHFATMEASVTELKKSRFGHLEDNVKRIEEQIRTFNRTINSPQINNGNAFDDAKRSFLTFLEGEQGRLAHHKTIAALPAHADTDVTH